MICSICPHLCDIPEGGIGKCLTRHNVKGKIENKYHGQVSLLTVEPIEKKPLFHFDSGKKYLNVGFLGCSMACTFCFNHTISQSDTAKTQHYEPHQLISLAKSKSLAGIAFSFNEPTVHYEFIRDLCEVKEDIHVVVKSNGFVNTEIIHELRHVDAFNIDIKGDDLFYTSECNGSFHAVINTIKELIKNGKHVEVSYLASGVDEFHRSTACILSDISKDIPVHVLALYPFHKMTHITYNTEHLCQVRDIMKERMKHVYISNVHTEEFLKYRHTFCQSCGNMMVFRGKEVIVHKTSCCQV